MIKEKINSFVKHPLSISILGTLIILIFANSVRYYNIIPIVYEIHDNIDTLVSKEEELRKSIIELKENYLAKDYEGSEITVGVSTELEQNTVSVFNGNKVNLKYSDAILLTNSIHMYRPSIKLVVGLVRERNNDNSKAEIFISQEAAKLLGFKDYKKTGILRANIKRIEKD